MKFSNSAALALAAVVSTATAKTLGFNYGAADTNGAAHTQQQFEQFFDRANGLKDAPGDFNSARLYTMIQGGTKDDPISAIPAALNKDHTLLFGLWASAGDDIFENELSALQKAISTYGDKLKGKVTGISVGSEDLYRDSDMGKKANAGIGINADTLVGYIKKVKDILKDSPLSDVPVGHVDTWTAWVDGANAEVIQNIDWLGFDAYPYFQDTMDNSIDDAKGLFYEAMDKTQSVAGGREVWVTETGWPVSGKKSNLADANTDNAERYWQEVGCEIFDKYHVYWYTLQDADPATPNPSFGILDASGKQLYDLKCNAKNTTEDAVVSGSSSAVASSTAVASSSAAASSAPASSAAVASSAPVSSAAAAASSAPASSAAGVESSAVAATPASSAAAGPATSAAGAAASSTGSSSGSGEASASANQEAAASSGAEVEASNSASTFTASTMVIVGMISALFL